VPTATCACRLLRNNWFALARLGKHVVLPFIPFIVHPALPALAIKSAEVNLRSNLGSLKNLLSKMVVP